MLTCDWFFIVLLSVMMMLLQACVSVDSDQANNETAAHYNVQLGLAYLAQQDMPSAKEKLILALQQAPTSLETLDAIAYFWEKSGNNQLAENYYLRAVKLAPNNGMVLNNYGAFLCKQKQQATAIKLFLRAAQDTNYINSGAAYENAGLCAMIIPDTRLAMVYFNKALQQDPKRTVSKTALTALMDPTKAQ